ncbi:hypothetical protein [Psychroserpens luteolus]|uniref:hypothetical protein n=1 Tax=Psychroserpens luteolus TaxID=2855840 RepID=UPI001E3F5928|nr:hypothetical protein [Psychroserpens luteolus]MCD2258351.1 hypothetical protein [Psychroserpens luteolus]
MEFKKSPFPYILLLSSILSIAFYANRTWDKKMNEPLTYSLHKIENSSKSELTNLAPPSLISISAAVTKDTK